MKSNTSEMIVIVDYGMGNLSSIQNMIYRIGGTSEISSDIDIIRKADKLILPGVGAFDNAMTNLKELNLTEVLNEKALKDRIPVLGICLGMQIVSLSSEEGVLPGLGWVNARTIRFDFNGSNIRVPHMGWNRVDRVKDHPIVKNFSEEMRFYFVHSYHVVCSDKEDVLMQTEYGFNFTSAIQHDNIMATQFHPEKSHKYGMLLLKNFLEL